MLRRLLSLIGVAVGCAGVGVFVGVGVQVWKVKVEVNRQTKYLATRAHSAGDAADHAIGFVGEVIDKARVDLNRTRQETGKAKSDPVNPFLRMTARQASVNLVGSVEQALGAVTAASDAVVVVDSAIHLVSEQYPTELEQLFGVHPQQVADTRGKLVRVASELKEAKSVLGVPIPSSGHGGPTQEQLDAVDEALTLAERFRGDMSHVVVVARTRVDTTQEWLDTWAWRLAVGTTVLCVWGCIGQVFLVRFSLRRLQQLPA